MFFLFNTRESIIIQVNIYNIWFYKEITVKFWKTPYLVLRLRYYENQKFTNSSCDYSFSFNMNHCSLTAQQLSVNSYNKMVWTYHNIHNNKTIIAICCKPINFICTDFILQKTLFCDISIQENIYVACLSSFCVWVYFRRFSSLM